MGPRAIDRRISIPFWRPCRSCETEGLPRAGVVAAIHRRRVLPLTERRLLLLEMTRGVDLEGS
jgi:hypothetical protein